MTFKVLRGPLHFAISPAMTLPRLVWFVGFLCVVLVTLYSLPTLLVTYLWRSIKCSYFALSVSQLLSAVFALSSYILLKFGSVIVFTVLCLNVKVLPRREGPDGNFRGT